MIRVERDPAFWSWVAEHPAVASSMIGFDATLFPAILGLPAVQPLASANGGFLFTTMDGVGFVSELHTLYRPEGWGREVHGAAKEAFERVFAGATQVVVTYEMEDNERSQPPRSFGFVACGEFAPSRVGTAKGWVLTKTAWLTSKARTRMIKGGHTCH